MTSDRPRPPARLRAGLLQIVAGRIVDHEPVSDAKMRNLARGCLAGWGASRLGGGCLGTVILFIILYILLGYVF